MRTIALAVACCAMMLVAAHDAAARERNEPVAQVEVSKPATSLPGTRYAWVEMPAQLAVEFDKRVQDPKLRTRLQAALDKALQGKGYRRVDSTQQADIFVAYRVGVRDVQQATVRDNGLQSARETAIGCSGGGCSQIVTQGPNGVPTIKIDTVDFIEGGLLFEVLEPGQIRVLWRALYRGSVRAKGAAPINLDTVASKTLAALPKAAAASP